MQRTSGMVTDRPWGQTLATLGTRGFTGLLTLAADGKELTISFDVGRVVGATSPLASDAAVRIALTNHLVSSSQVADLSRRIAAAKDRDDLEVLAELAQLAPEHVDKLRRKLVAQRAARTFSYDQGEFTIEERIAMPPGAALDIQEIVYLGARMNLTEQRLTTALRRFGAVFVIKHEALPSLEKFGFTTEEDPVIQRLLEGASLPELEAAHRDLDPRMVQAVVYALAACGACFVEQAPGAAVEYGDGPAVAPRTTPATEGAYFVSRTQTNPAIVDADPSAPAVARTSSTRSPAPPTIDEGVTRIPPRRLPTEQPATSRTSTGDVIRSRPDMSDATGFRSGDPPPPRTVTPRPGTSSSGIRAPGQPTIPRTRGSSPAVARTSSPEIASPRTKTVDPSAPAAARTQTSDPAVARTASGRLAGPAVARTATARKTQALIAARMILVEQGADYFTLLGIPFDAPLDVVQTTYLNLVRQLHPDKLDELGVTDASGQANKVFHQIGIAFSVLTDPARRAAYLEQIGRPSGAIELTSRTRTADDVPAGPAGDAYRRGETALRRDVPAEAVVEFGRACALDPNNVDFHAMLGWAQFCAASDKATIAPETRKALERALQRSAKPTSARFLLGRVERMLGRDREAQRHFQDVLEASPGHAEAAAELRAIDARLAKAGKR